MNVLLSPELEEIVNEKVQTGMYHSPSEVIREGLKLLKEQDTLQQLRLNELRKEIAFGIEQADRGELAPLDIAAIKAEGRQILAERRRQ